MPQRGNPFNHNNGQHSSPSGPNNIALTVSLQIRVVGLRGMRSIVRGRIPTTSYRPQRKSLVSGSIEVRGRKPIGTVLSTSASSSTTEMTSNRRAPHNYPSKSAQSGEKAARGTNTRQTWPFRDSRTLPLEPKGGLASYLPYAWPLMV